MKRLALLLLLPLVVSLFLSVGYYATAQDTAVLSMSGANWNIKVDSTLQTALDSKSTPYTSVLKSGTEKELFLTLNSLKDCVSGEIQFKIETSGLTVYKQLPLDKELSVDGKEGYTFVNSTIAMIKDKVVVSRPENVVNSFACFDESGKKVLHIYASKLVDAKGNSVWVDSDLLKDGLLTVYLDQKWLNEAVFPVIVDPTFGYTSIGGSAYAGGELQGYKVTASDSGISHYITWYGSVDSGKKVKTALYDSNQTLIQGGTEQTGVLSLGWHNFTYVTTNPNIVSGHSYTVVYWLEDGSSGNGYFDSTGSGTWAHQTLAYGAFPNPAAFTFTDLSFSIYAEVSNDTEPTPTPTPSPSPSPSPSPTPSATPTPTPSNIDLTMVILFGLTVLFSVLAFLSKESFFFVLAGIMGLIFGIYLAIESFTISESWSLLTVGVCMIFYGLFMPIVGLKVSLKGKNK